MRSGPHGLCRRAGARRHGSSKKWTVCAQDVKQAARKEPRSHVECAVCDLQDSAGEPVAPAPKVDPTQPLSAEVITGLLFPTYMKRFARCAASRACAVAYQLQHNACTFTVYMRVLAC